MESVSYEYLAGLFDGEGCASAPRSSGGTCYPSLSLGMIDENGPRALYNKFGGSLSCRPMRGTRKPLWFWNVSSQAALIAARALAPFCLCKRNQLELIIELQEMIDREYHEVRVKRYLSLEQKDRRLKIAAKLRELHGNRGNHFENRKP